MRILHPKSLWCSALLFFICLLMSNPTAGAERVIILNTAVSPILLQLGLESVVVGVTYNDEVFSDRTRIGSHLSPNIELIRALQPDLIIAGSKRAFPDEMADRFKSNLFRYDPRDLQEILDTVMVIGRLFQKEKEAIAIVKRENQRLEKFVRTETPVTMVFEISQQPLKLAGRLNIVNSIIERAGGKNLVTIENKHVLISPEKVLMLNPDLYLYQNGPMNKNPVTPKKRNVFKTLKSRVLEVDQLQYTRAGLNAFDAVEELNKMIRQLNR